MRNAALNQISQNYDSQIFDDAMNQSQTAAAGAGLYTNGGSLVQTNGTTSVNDESSELKPADLEMIAVLYD